MMRIMEFKRTCCAFCRDKLRRTEDRFGTRKTAVQLKCSAILQVITSVTLLDLLHIVNSDLCRLIIVFIIKRRSDHF